MIRCANARYWFTNGLIGPYGNDTGKAPMVTVTTRCTESLAGSIRAPGPDAHKTHPPTAPVPPDVLLDITFSLHLGRLSFNAGDKPTLCVYTRSRLRRGSHMKMGATRG